MLLHRSGVEYPGVRDTPFKVSKQPLEVVVEPVVGCE
jgi:hypothetical protein